MVIFRWFSLWDVMLIRINVTLDPKPCPNPTGNMAFPHAGSVSRISIRLGFRKG